MITRIALSLALIGAALLVASSFLAPYKDQAALDAARVLYLRDIASSHEASVQYWAVRDAQLTPKFTLQDYGVTLAVAALLLIIGRVGLSIRDLSEFASLVTPVKFWKIVALGLCATFISPVAVAASLFLGATRDEFPPWADSLGIPLAGVPITFMFLLACLVGFSLLGRTHYAAKRPFARAFCKDSQPNFAWCIVFGVPLFLSGCAAALALVSGDFLFFAPSVLWATFFLCLFAGKQQRMPANPSLNADAPEAARRLA